jgi:wyosine [tRNA(Phe)-imidazoG37] synthetase (radical SAM superfamily)
MKGNAELLDCIIDSTPVEPSDTFVQAQSGVALAHAKLLAAQFEPTKLFIHADCIGDWLRGKLPCPITLELDLTLSCNDKCPYCPHGFAHQGRYLELESIRQILDEAAGLGIRGLTITGGGEPLMHPRILDVLRLVRRYRFSAGIITNAGRVTAEIADELVASCQWIRVSLDAATETSFQRVRGHRGMAHRLERISLLVDAKRRNVRNDCEIGTSFLTCSDTADEIVDAAHLSRALGFDYIQFKPMVRWLGINKHRSPLMNQDGVISALETASKLQDETFRVLVTSHRYEAELSGARRSYSAFHCAWFIVAVGPNTSGERVRPTLYLDCSTKYVPQWTIGEFDSLEKILRTDRRRQIIASASSDSYCIQSEKHATYNALLDSVLHRHRRQPLSFSEIRSLSPAEVKHPDSL